MTAEQTPPEWLARYLEDGSLGPTPPGDEPPTAPTTPPPAAARLRDQLADAGTWVEPPDGLLDRILTDIEAERAVLAGGAPTPESPAAVAPATEPAQAVAPARRRSRRRWLASVAASVVVLAAVVVAGVVATNRPSGTQLNLAGTTLAPAAHAEATLRSTPSGLAITLDVRGLPPSAPGSFYEAWMKGPRGLVSIGTFHLRGGTDTIDLWSAVSLADYPTLTVTRETEDGNPASSGQVVLTSRP